MKARTLPQNKLLHALAAEVARHYPIVPWSRALAREAWKRYFIQLWVREMRMEAYANGQSDPFPVRPVPSRSLESWQMDALIECAIAFCALELDLILE